MKKEPKVVFKKFLLACGFIFISGIYLTIRGSKEKVDFPVTKGKIDYLDSTFANYTPRDTRYIHVESSPIVFQLFIGKETGDFSPKFEQLDKLKLGDEISIYYADKSALQKNSDVFNKTVQFIDKNNDAYFIRGNKDKYGGYFFIIFGILMTLFVFILKHFGKIK